MTNYMINDGEEDLMRYCERIEAHLWGRLEQINELRRSLDPVPVGTKKFKPFREENQHLHKDNNLVK